MSSQVQSKNPPPDQRYLPRWEVRNRVTCYLENQKKVFDAQTNDLSCSGICIFTNEPLKMGQSIKLTVYLSKNKSVDVAGNVVWIKQGPIHNQVGIHFFNINEDDQAIILDHAFELNRDLLVKHWFKGWEGAT